MSRVVASCARSPRRALYRQQVAARGAQCVVSAVWQRRRQPGADRRARQRQDSS